MLQFKIMNQNYGKRPCGDDDRSARGRLVHFDPILRSIPEMQSNQWLPFLFLLFCEIVFVSRISRISPALMGFDSRSCTHGRFRSSLSPPP
jgi:hypothetical protein